MTDLVADLAFSASTDAAINHSFFDADRGDCGSAWVVLPQQKGRKALLAAIQAESPSLRVSKHHTGGLALHILSGIRNQSRAIKEAGCDAFCDTLERHGFKADTHSCAD